MDEVEDAKKIEFGRSGDRQEPQMHFTSPHLCSILLSILLYHFEHRILTVRMTHESSIVSISNKNST